MFPKELVTPCILAGCPPGKTVLDPFAGTGTVGQVAEEHGRNAILIELNPVYVEMQKTRSGASIAMNPLPTDAPQEGKGWLF